MRLCHIGKCAMMRKKEEKRLKLAPFEKLLSVLYDSEPENTTVAHR